MSNKKILLLSILFALTFIVTIVAIIFALLNHQKSNPTKNMDIIQNNYLKFSSHINENVEIRKQLAEKLGEFDNATYQENHDEYTELLTNYDKNMQIISDLADTLEPKCRITYEDATTNILCQSYEMLYEQMINIYISKVTDYNNKINSYNQLNNANYKKHKLLYSEYVDIDNNGKYQGKETA